MLSTQAINKKRHSLKNWEEIWLFGYGSLIYKVDFPVLDRKAASITGWKRRFWQGSHDHRGTPEYPGRVATLVPDPGGQCAGVAYRVTHEVFDHLDHREKNGYLRYQLELQFSANKVKPGLVYIAPQSNAAFLGSASEREIAEHIAVSKGPSGSNSDYVFQLADALREMDESDSHVFDIERHLRELTNPL